MTPPKNARHAPPKATAMVEALRGLGYSTATALADIVDNSITAGANTVDVSFTWNQLGSYLTIQDDGRGMNDIELDRAMRLGEKNPLDCRDSNDLGRFGLGLKTASLSQCRRLTVASKKARGDLHCLRWDLDVLATSDDDGWYLLEGPDEGSSELLEQLSATESGTLVIWENLDRIVTRGFSEQNFLDLIDCVERHLAMVFHRYLKGPNPRIRILLNDRAVGPWDPFLTDHAATWTSPKAFLETDAGQIEVQCHVLPHQDRLDQREYKTAGGPDGWTAQQGFYLYRNERLLVSGSWLGLGLGRSWTKEEAHRLARIRLDIPNSADAEWKIDIRKSTAKPPVTIRPTLTRLAEDTRARARRVFAHRSQSVRVHDSQPIVQAWRAEYFGGGMRYRIDIEHPAVKAVLEEAGDLKAGTQAMLRVLEETVPVQRIWLDTADGGETPRTGFAGETPAGIKAVLGVMFKNLVKKKGLSSVMAREQLLHTEPFHNFPDLVASLSDETITEE